MNMISLDCPKCGASLSTDGDREFFFCQNCGNKIVLQNENEFIIRHVEDVEAIQAKTDQYVQMKKIEILEKMQNNKEQRKPGKIVLTIVLALIGAALGIVGVLSCGGKSNTELVGPIFAIMGGIMVLLLSVIIWTDGEESYEDQVARLEGKIKAPHVFSEIEKKKYQEVSGAFRNAGFTNVTCQKRNDLAIGLRHKANTVATVLINGEEVTSRGNWYQPDAPVVIVYHTFVWKRD